jgi:hypothetical protein
MTDVINWHKQYPDDWKKCWEEIEKKWGTNDKPAQMVLKYLLIY